MGYKNESTTRFASALEGDVAPGTVLATTNFPIQRQIKDVWIIATTAWVNSTVAGVFGVNIGATQIGTVTILGSAAVFTQVDMVWDAGQERGQFLEPGTVLTIDVNIRPEDVGGAAACTTIFDVYVRHSS